MTAIQAVVDLFKGQEISHSEFTVTRREKGDNHHSLGLTENQLGIGNRLQLHDEEIHDNLKQIQLRNSLRPSETLTSGDFTVENGNPEQGRHTSICVPYLN